MKPKQTCPECGMELLPTATADTCPRCLLKAGLERDPERGKSGTPRMAPWPVKHEPLAPGTRFEHYQILRLLGEGGMGAAYAAQDLDTNRHVVLKLMSDPLDSLEARRRFMHEGRNAASINHPNSVYVFGTEQFAGIPVISMEYVAGDDLNKRVREQGPMPFREAVDAILQVIAGLEAALAANVFHRDIKPANCFLAADGTIKVGDYGLAKSGDVALDSQITAPNTSIGTLAYSSPEQLRGNMEKPTVEADVYSLGGTLYYLLTGKTPFHANNRDQYVALILESPAESPAKIRPEIPAGLCQIVLRCLEKQPARRFSNYFELREQLLPFSSAASKPASLGKRFLAGAVDSLILLVMAMITGWTVGRFWLLVQKPGQVSYSLLISAFTINACLVLAYYGLMESWWGASLGKRLLRLRVMDESRNFPSMFRAGARAAILVGLTQTAPALVVLHFLTSPPSIASLVLMVLGTYSFYIILALIFSTARKKNGWAAIHDLWTRTRVVVKAAGAVRSAQHEQRVKFFPPETAFKIGPYHVLETPDAASANALILAYDDRLLRKVWIRKSPIGAPAVSTVLRDLGRPGRLRWLNGTRSADEAWDAYEAVSGKLLSQLAGQPQPWNKVRLWLLDLAEELNAGIKDQSLPGVIDLDRVWITNAGYAKILDFPVTEPLAIPASELGKPAVLPPPSSHSRFLSAVAVTALTGQAMDANSPKPPEINMPVPLHCRNLLVEAHAGLGLDVMIDRLKTSQERVAVISRERRTAMVAACIAFPVFATLCAMLGMWAEATYHEYEPLMICLSKLEQAERGLLKGGLDGRGGACPAELLPASMVWDQTPFKLGPSNDFDFVSCKGQEVPMPGGSHSALKLLAAGTRGEQPGQQFMINYADGTRTPVSQSFSDWLSPQERPGEARAATFAYVNAGDGSKHGSNAFIYGYSFGLDPARSIKSVTLPTNENVEILAMTLAAPETTVSLERSFNYAYGIVTQGTVFSKEARLREALRIYIPGRFRERITNSPNWNWFAKQLFTPNQMNLAKRLVATSPVPAEEDFKRSAEVVESLIPGLPPFKALVSDKNRSADEAGTDSFSETSYSISNPIYVLAIFAAEFAMAVGTFAMMAAIFFRGGLILWIFGLMVVCKDGSVASRWRIFWRSFIVWAPFWLLFIWMCFLCGVPSIYWAKVIAFATWGGVIALVVFSTILPARSWQDRLAGTSLIPK